MHRIIYLQWVSLRVALSMHWTVSPYFLCVYICLCKKAYHLLLDQPLPMAPLLLLPHPLPPLPPSLRPSMQVSAWFSSAKPPHCQAPSLLTASYSTTS